MATHARFSGWQHALRLAATSLCVACVGTPTPEPPDYSPLPRPDGAGILSTVRTLAEVDIVRDAALEPVTVPLAARANTVQGDADLWVVNLDEPDSPPLTFRARPDGSFETVVTGRIGQRLRLVYRTAGEHSLPLDLEIAGNLMGAAITPLRASTMLTCFSVEPKEEISVAVIDGASSSRAFTLTNRCAESVALERAELRFGDVGFRLTTPPESVPANGSAELTVIFPRHDDATERADIVLLELATGQQRVRHALGVWSRGSDD
jgi:hypothetical protein